MENIKMPGGLLVAIPFSRLITPEWAMSMMTQGYPIATNLTYFTTRNVEVGEARQQMAEKALELGTRYLFFVDDDVAPPVFAARKLIYELEQNGPPMGKAMVCGGIYCTKEDPPYPIVFKEQGAGASWDWKVGDVFPCFGIGTGCLMIRTEVFKYLPKPWFKTIDKDPTDAHEFRHQMTDDLYFCELVRNAGFEILAHGGVIPIHWDEKQLKPYMLPKGCAPLREYEAALAEGISLSQWKEKHAGLSLDEWKQKNDNLEAQAKMEAAHAGD